jgi:ABC-2 type transport system permease protein
MAVPTPGVRTTELLWSIRYEVLMAARRRAVWAAVLPLVALTLLLAFTSPVVTGASDPVTRVGVTAVLVNSFCTLGLALALTDRLRRNLEARGMPELLAATPAGRLPRVMGTLLGPLLTALAPVAALLLAYGAFLSLTAGSGRPLAAAVAALGTAVLPAAALAAAAAGLLGVLMPVAAARAVTVVLWLWATNFPPRFSPVPTPTGTVLSPLGGYPLAAWAGAPDIWAARGAAGPLRPDITTTSALLNLALVLLTAAACHALCLLTARLRRHGA